jgi:hypothetical protein
MGKRIGFFGAGAAVLAFACSGGSSGGHDTAHGDGGPGGSAAAGSGSQNGNTSDGTGTPCPAIGQTRACCAEAGHQTCGGNDEFTMWGPCLDDDGKRVTCTFHDTADCGTAEFSASCDGVPDAGGPRVCGEGEFGDACVGDGGLPPKPGLCTDKTVNNEPEILAGYAPDASGSVGQSGQIKVWITDEWPAVIAPGEQVDLATGKITTAGDRSAKALDGYLLEPALYIAPLTVEAGGPPHFPQYVKGWFNNGAPSGGGGKHMMMTTATGTPNVMQGVAVDTPPAGVNLSEKYSTEFIWDVSKLGLSPGTYYGEFVVPDGDNDRAVGCVTITITK